MKIKDVIRESLDYKTARHWSLGEWANWLAAKIKNGAIYKPEFAEAKKILTTNLEKSFKEISDRYYLGAYAHGDSMRDQLNDLYWASPSSLSSLNKLEKTAKNSPDSPFKMATLELVNAYRPVAQALEQVKPLIVTATQNREIKKKEQEVQKAAEKGSAEALIQALEPNKKQYVEEAKKRATRLWQERKQKLENAGGLNAIAPEVDWRLASKDYEAHKKAKQLREFWTYVDRTSVEDYANQAARGAAKSYDAWTYKLIQKIGKPVVQAEVTGDPWMGSTITVKTNDGDTQRWDTKMIINFSKYGKAFNQFPTRRKS